MAPPPVHDYPPIKRRGTVDLSNDPLLFTSRPQLLIIKRIVTSAANASDHESIPRGPK
jgi:hypothetical protein